MSCPKSSKLLLSCCIACFLLSGCVIVGPDYSRPMIPIPAAYKEDSKKHWAKADPADLFPRGQWWTVFHEPRLNTLENELVISNQTIIAAKAQYRQAQALVAEARASYFPTLSLSMSSIRQSSGNFGGNIGNQNNNANNMNNGGNGNSNINTVNQANLNASWEPDIFGGTHRSVEASMTAAQSSQATLAATQLAAEASLAQYYFELQGVDRDQQLLNKTAVDNQKIMQLTTNRYHQGVASLADVVQARSQWETAKAAAIDLGINRGQYEHAIAVLVGKSPADLSLAFHPTFQAPPVIASTLPSLLLQRRPDIAAAERTVAQANAQIGVAVSAYFPSLQFSPSVGVMSFTNWFSSPIYNWSIGPLLTETLLDGGLRKATVAAARANYDATVAQYRQTILGAFQEVEDNLLALRVLHTESRVKNLAAKDAALSLQLTVNNFKAGTTDYPAVLTAQINALSAQKSAVDINTLQMTSTVGLIKSLGGGWSQADLMVFRSKSKHPIAPSK